MKANNFSLKQAVSFIGKCALFIYLAFVLASFDYRLISPGLDPSYNFAINFFINNHIIFGRDVIWTYGPFGFLAHPVPLANNLEIAFIFQFITWLIFLGVIVYFSLKNYFTIMQLFLFAVFVSLGKIPINMMVDYFICFLVILLLSLSFSGKRHIFLYFLALLFSSILWFVKFNSALMATLAILSGVFIMAFVDRKKYFREISLALIFIPVLFIIIYLSYNFSFADLVSYLRGAYEISSGYSFHSICGRDFELFIALIFAALYFLLIILLVRFQKKSLAPALIFLIPIFIAFKRGFVRQDSHVLNFIGFFLFSFGMIFLFTDFRGLRKIAKILIFSVALLVSLTAVSYFKYMNMNLSPLGGFYNAVSMLRIINHKDEIISTQNKGLNAMRLPTEALEMTAGKTITTFPFEISYIPANNLNYKPLPVFQVYSAYTSYLDLLNSQSIEDNKTASNFMLMEWNFIDSRHMLADVPATWLSIYKWYDVKYHTEDLLILGRRDNPRFNNMELLKRGVIDKHKYIEIPTFPNPIIIKIHMQLSFLGKLTKFFFRVPEVMMELCMNSKNNVNFRVMPDTLNNGLFINFIPLNLKDIYVLINDDASRNIVNSFRIYGKGTDFYNDRIEFDIYRIPEIKINSVRAADK